MATDTGAATRSAVVSLETFEIKKDIHGIDYVRASLGCFARGAEMTALFALLAESPGKVRITIIEEAQ